MVINSTGPSGGSGNGVQRELMTAAEVIDYLRLDVLSKNPTEKLRSLIRRQGLPAKKRGRLRLFRRSQVDAWLDGENGRKMQRLTRLQGK